MSDTTIQEKRAIFEKVINNPNLPDSAKKIAREGLAKLSEGTPKAESSNKSSDSEKRAIFEKVINNPNLPESAKKIAKEGLAKLSGGESKTEAKKEKVVKQPKEKKEKVVKQPKEKKENTSVIDYDCDTLISKEKEKAKKRKEAAEKRKNAPKKKESTKIKEGIEKLEDKVEEKVSKGKITKAEIIKLIDNTKALLKSLEKQLQELDKPKKMANGGNVEKNINEKVLSFLTQEKKDEVLSNIAKHYRISKKEALEEVTDNEAERLYEYISNNPKLRMDIYNAYNHVNANKFAKGGSIKRTEKSIDADINLRAMPKGERVSHPFAIIRKANGETFKRRNANQFGRVEGDGVYTENRANRTDKDQKKRF